MAETSLHIALKLNDMAGGRIGTVTKAMVRDLEGFNRRAAELTMSAKDFELRALDERFAAVRAKYAAYADRIDRAEENARQRLMAARAQASVGMFEGEDTGAIQAELDKIRGLRSRNAEVQAASARAEAAERQALMIRTAETEARSEDALRTRRISAAAEQRDTMLRRAESEAKAEDALRTRRMNDIRGLEAVTMTARQRELRDVRAHYAELERRYAGDAAMRVRIKTAEMAQVQEIESRHAQTGSRGGARNSEWLSRGLRAGGFSVLAAGITSGAMQYATAAAREGTATTPQEAIQNRLATQQAASSAVGFLPIVGGMLQGAIEAGQDRPGMERFGREVEQTTKALADMVRETKAAGAALGQARDKFLGRSAAEQAQAAVGSNAEAIRQREVTAVRAAIEARSEVEKARQRGIKNVSLFQDRADAADAGVQALRSMGRQQMDIDRQAAAAAAEDERRAFSRSMDERSRGAVFVGSSLGGQQAASFAALEAKQAAEAEDMRRARDRRSQDLTSGGEAGWRGRWQEREFVNRGGAALTSTTEQAALRKRLAQESAQEYKAESDRVQDLTDRLGKLGDVQAKERDAARDANAKAIVDETRRLALERRNAQASGPEVGKARERELADVDDWIRDMGERYAGMADMLANAEQTAQEKRKAIRDRYARDEMNETRALALRRVNAELSGPSLRDALKRELAGIAESYRQAREKYADNPEMIARLDKTQKAEEEAARRNAGRRERDAVGSLQSQFFRAAGYGRAATVMDTMAQNRGLREQFAGNASALKTVDALESLQLQRLAMPRQSREVTANEAGRFQTYAAGYEDPAWARKLADIQREASKLLRDDMKTFIKELPAQFRDALTGVITAV